MAAVAAVLQDSEVDVVSLQEVENIEMLTELRDRYGLRERFPYFQLIEGNDFRKGYDVAVLSRYPIKRFETHKDRIIGAYEGREQRFRRDLLEVDVEFPNSRTLRVFANHFIAFPGQPYCDDIRRLEAIEARKIVLEQSQKYPVSYSAIMGDFNDEESSDALKLFSKGGLSNVTRGLPPSWGELRETHYPPTRLDHIMADGSLASRVKGRGIFRHPQEALASDHRLVYIDVELEAV